MYTVKQEVFGASEFWQVMEGENIIRRFRVDEHQPDSAKAHAEWLIILLVERDELKTQIQRLHEQYAHEGGKPQIMTADILKRWLGALDIPMVTDIYQTNAPNVFYATFAKSLFPDDKAQIQALGIEVIFPNSTLRNRYMLKWQTPPNDEE